MTYRLIALAAMLAASMACAPGNSTHLNGEYFKSLAKLDIVHVGRPEDFGRLMAGELATWGRVIKAAGL